MRNHFMPSFLLVSDQETKKMVPAQRPQRAIPTLSREQAKLFQGLEHSAFSIDRFAKGYKPVSSAK